MSVVALQASNDSVSSNNRIIHSKNSTTEAQQSSRQNNNKYVAANLILFTSTVSHPKKTAFERMRNVFITKWLHKYGQPIAMSKLTKTDNKRVMPLFKSTGTSASSSCSLRVRCISCSLILKVELVPPSLLWSSNVPSSFWSVFQCLCWQSISVHPLYVL